MCAWGRRVNVSARWCASAEDGQRRTPPLIDLARMYAASRSVEQGQETAEDLRYLQGKGTSLGGMRPKCSVIDEEGWLAPQRDMHALWRRLVFNLLITNVDDHLHNHGFLHVGHGLWRLSPVFDINPFPDKDRESKVWLSEQDGPIVDVGMLLARSADFSLTRKQALRILSEVVGAVSNWRQVAVTPEVGLKRNELDEIAPAFEHVQLEKASNALLT